jgi:hypothetical protein
MQHYLTGLTKAAVDIGKIVRSAAKGSVMRTRKNRGSTLYKRIESAISIGCSENGDLEILRVRHPWMDAKSMRGHRGFRHRQAAVEGKDIQRRARL